MIQILKVTGESLSPFFQDGDFVLIIKIPFFLRSVRQGDIVVFHHPVYGTMIKRVEHVSPDGEQIEVIGSHPDSTDSRQFGPIARRALIGKVIWHIRKVGLHKEPGS
jgi:nickel-type superoxide dismutase maturation protease